METMDKSFLSGIATNPSCGAGCAHTHSNPFLGDYLFSTILCSVERYKYLVSRIEILEEALRKETQERQEADASLNARVDQEITDRIEGDVLLTSRLETEAEERIDADKILDHKLSTETQDRINADANLSDVLNNEQQGRINADQTLESKLSTETQNRINGDNNVRAELTITIQDIAKHTKPAEGAKADTATVKKLKKVGKCPQGLVWARRDDGWNCMDNQGNWGNHFITDDELNNY